MPRPSLLGLGIAAASLSRNIVLRQVARFYVEIIRGVPILVLLLYAAFVVAPGMVAGWNLVAGSLGLEPVRTRDFSLLWRAVMALTIGYSAFLSEVFRAGLQAVDEGQVEAAEALGLGRWLRFRHIVFPQALRTILPPLGNDFVAMIKDSSLVSVLGVLDVTQLGKITAAGQLPLLRDLQRRGPDLPDDDGGPVDPAAPAGGAAAAAVRRGVFLLGPRPRSGLAGRGRDRRGRGC